MEALINKSQHVQHGFDEKICESTSILTVDDLNSSQNLSIAEDCDEDLSESQSKQKETNNEENSQFYTDMRPNTVAPNSRCVKNSKFKCNSDIYPVIKKNSLMNQSHDYDMHMNELNAFEPAMKSKSTAENGCDDPELNANQVKLKQTAFKNIQVNENQIVKNVRQLMLDRKEARRLEISELLAEQLVESALLANCTDNVTVNCVLFSACNL